MKYIYEFIGTFFLVFTVGMTVLSPHDAGMMAPLAIGAVLAVMIFAGGHVSGAHYNPAVSFSLFLRGKLNGKDLLNYWGFQLVAAVIAGYFVLYLKGSPAEAPLQIETWKAFLAEFLFTFALCFVVLNVAASKETKGNSFFGFAIGFTVLAGAYAVGKISGGAFNPAVALSIALMNLVKWSDLWIFLVANMVAGASAAWIFNKAAQEKYVKEELAKKVVENAR